MLFRILDDIDDLAGDIFLYFHCHRIARTEPAPP